MQQKTIKDKVALSGIGLHSGEHCQLLFHPAEENCGLVFLVNQCRVPAKIENVFSATRGTVLKKDGQLVILTEHLLAACYALGLSNLLIEMSAAEPPALDGSALPFVEALKSATVIGQAGLQEELSIPRPVEVCAGCTVSTGRKPAEMGATSEARILATPAQGLTISFSINFPVAGAQSFSFALSEETFIAEIAPARTFGFVSEVDDLKKNGLARGATLENALAIGPAGYLNPPRFADELVRHKILDLVGDLALLGRRVNASFTCEKSGHALNVEMGKKLARLYML